MSDEEFQCFIRIFYVSLNFILIIRLICFFICFNFIRIRLVEYLGHSFINSDNSN